jgi:shikimate kinase
MRKIILTGYMGSGKSTIARLLSERMEMKWLDLDEIIEKKSGLSIVELFKQKGEIHFRKLEHDFFKTLMTSNESFILSLGGGTPCYANNHELLNGEGIVSIYLKASIDTLYNRILNNENERPLVVGKPKEEMREFIAKHLFDRSFYYNQSTFKVDTNNKIPEQVIPEIENMLA